MCVKSSSIVICSVALVSLFILVAESRHSDGTRRHQSGDSTSRRSSPQYNCSQCSGSSEVNRDDKRNYRLESIKADILRKLHLRSPPNVTGRQLPALPHIQQWIEKLSVHQNDGEFGMDYDGDGNHRSPAEESDDDRATTMKVFQFSRSLPVDRQLDPSQAENTCYFPFPMSEVQSIEQIVRMTLGIYIRPVPYDPRGPSPSTVLIISSPVPGGSPKTIASRRIYLGSSSSGRWYTFRLSSSHYQNWLNHPTSNFGILVQSSVGRGELAVVTPRNSAEEPYRPYLEIETRELTTSRRRRSTDMNCDERSTERLCCRYPLEVDFASFQWDWIIVPTRYSAYYCSGECPYLFMQQYGSSHLGQIARPNGAGGPCCSPRKLSPISMLYYDQNMNIVYGKLPGMVVDQCGCS